MCHGETPKGLKYDFYRISIEENQRVNHTPAEQIKSTGKFKSFSIGWNDLEMRAF
tara:strand:- start:127 stop:291 length:165 start_codon:yes stop_codon:yes gene_type:complete